MEQLEMFKCDNEPVVDQMYTSNPFFTPGLFYWRFKGITSKGGYVLEAVDRKLSQQPLFVTDLENFRKIMRKVE